MRMHWVNCFSSQELPQQQVLDRTGFRTKKQVSRTGLLKNRPEPYKREDSLFVVRKTFCLLKVISYGFYHSKAALFTTACGIFFMLVIFVIFVPRLSANLQKKSLFLIGENGGFDNLGPVMLIGENLTDESHNQRRDVFDSTVLKLVVNISSVLPLLTIYFGK